MSGVLWSSCVAGPRCVYNKQWPKKNVEGQKNVERDDLQEAKQHTRRNFCTMLVVTSVLVPVFLAACTPLCELRGNMPKWVGTVPYSHLVNRSWGYPTDCSGFVSWALQTGSDTKAYEWSADAYSTQISTDQLRYGDIITHVWDDTPLNRCSKSVSSPNATASLGLYLSGHVFFFDRWDDEVNRTDYWVYESTETENQTPECLAQKGGLTRSLCFNHYVKKSRKHTIDKWIKDKCKEAPLGTLAGGPRRLSPKLLCQNAST